MNVHINRLGKTKLALPVCGIKSFYVPRSHPDGYGVNTRCRDAGTVRRLHIRRIDGRNWEKRRPAGRAEYA